jgi:hypothetical protein
VAEQSSQFHIQLDGVSLSDEQRKALATELDKLVSSHLAKLDFRGDFIVTRPIALNPEWLGIWIRNQKLGKFVNAPSITEVPDVLRDLEQPTGGL